MLQHGVTAEYVMREEKECYRDSSVLLQGVTFYQEYYLLLLLSHLPEEMQKALYASSAAKLCRRQCPHLEAPPGKV